MLRVAGVDAMAKNKTSVKSYFKKLRDNCSKHVKGKSHINIVMDLIVADTDDGDAIEGNISVKVNGKEEINIPLKVLLVIIPPGEGWTIEMIKV